MKTARIFKEVNSNVYTSELFENNIYIESFYSKYKKDAISHCKKIGFKLSKPQNKTQNK